MNLLDIIKARQSVRTYADKEVEQEKISYIMECARLAPSAVNFQPWMFFLVKSEEGKKKLNECYPREWFATAPMYIIACGDTSKSWKRKADGKDHCDIDIAIAVEHICLAAAEQGLGTCWVCNFDIEMCSKLFNLPQNLVPIALIPIGYPTEYSEREEFNRKNMEEICNLL